MRINLLLSLVLGFAAFTRGEAPTSRPSLDSIIQKLHSENPDDRSHARDDLEKLELSSADSIKALSAAVEAFPDDPIASGAVVLVRAAGRSPRKECAPVIVQNFESYPLEARGRR